MPSPVSIGIAGAIAIVLWLAMRTIWGKLDLPYPPGPKRLPIIGNALDIDLKEPHVTYTMWGKTYGLYSRLISCHAWLITSLYAGDIVYSRIFGQDFLIVNSERIARILADQRSTIYSNRPHSPLYRM